MFWLSLGMSDQYIISMILGNVFMGIGLIRADNMKN